MIPGPFEYHRPGTVEEAVALLNQYGDAGQVIAGGHSLIPMMKLRMATPEHLIDIQGIDSLSSISVSGGQIEVGPSVTQAEIISTLLFFIGIAGFFLIGRTKKP